MGLLERIRGLFRGKPKAPKVPPREPARTGGLTGYSVPIGHGGIAAGDQKRRDALAEAQRQWREGGMVGPAPQDVYTAEETEKWRPLEEQEVANFLYHGLVLHVNSSNVATMQYFPDRQEMVVKFLSGGTYAYSNVSHGEAELAVRQKSKGGFIWDVFRVRGSRTAHKKPFRKVG